MSLNPGYIVPAFMKTVTGNYFNFEGRTNRFDFWHFYLAYFILSIIVGVVVGIIKIPIISTIFSLALLLPTLGAGVRRMHDIDKSGWFILIPLYNIYLLAQPGTPGTNRFGPAPAPGA